MTMPGVQNPHWRAWFSWNACCTGCSAPSVARPSIVVTSCPSAWTASSVHDLTDSPSRSTVHEPQDVDEQLPRLDLGLLAPAVDRDCNLAHRSPFRVDTRGYPGPALPAKREPAPSGPVERMSPGV